MTLSEYGEEEQTDDTLRTQKQSNEDFSLLENKTAPEQLYTILYINPSPKIPLKKNTIVLNPHKISYDPSKHQKSTHSTIIENNPTFKEFITLLSNYDKPLTNFDIEEISNSDIKIKLNSSREHLSLSFIDIFTIITQKDISDIPNLSKTLTQKDCEDIKTFIEYYGGLIQQYLNHNFYTKGVNNALVGHENIWKIVQHIYQKLGLLKIENGTWNIESSNISLAIISYIEYQHKLILVAVSENNVEELDKLLTNIEQIESLNDKNHLIIPFEIKAKMYYAKLVCELKLKTISSENITRYITILNEPHYYSCIDYLTKTDISLAILEYIQNNTITPELQDLCVNFVIGPKIRLYQALHINQLENTILQSLEQFALIKKNDFALFQINLYKIRTTNNRETIKNLTMKCFEILETSFNDKLGLESTSKEPLFLDSFLSRGLRKTLKDDDDKNRNVILLKHWMNDYTQYQTHKHLVEKQTTQKPNTKPITIDQNESTIDITSLDYSLERIDKTFSCRFVILGPKGTAILSHHFDGAGSIDLSPIIEETKEYIQLNKIGESREKFPTNTAINGQYTSNLYIRRCGDYTIVFNLNKNTPKYINPDTWSTSIDPLLEVIKDSLAENDESQPEEKDQFLSDHHRRFMNTIETSYINYFLQYDFSKRDIKEFSGEQDNIINQDLLTTRKDFTELKEGNNFAFGINSIRELVKDDPTYISSTYTLAEAYIQKHQTSENKDQEIYASVLAFTKIYDQIISYLGSKQGKDTIIETLHQQFPTGISTKGLKKFKTIFSCLHESIYQKQNGKGLLFRKLDFSNADVSLDPIIQETTDLISLIEYYQVLCHAFRREDNPQKKALEVIIIWANKKYLNPELVSGFQEFIEQYNKTPNIQQNVSLESQTTNKQSDGNILVDALYKQFIDEVENILKLLRKYEIMEVSTKTIIKGYMPDILSEIHKNLGFSCTITIFRHGATPSDLVVLPSLSVEQKKTEGLIDPNGQTAGELFELLQLKYDKEYETDREQLLSSILKEKYGIEGKNIKHFFTNMLSETGFLGTEIDAIHSATSTRCQESGSLIKELIGSKTPIHTMDILNNPDKHTGIRALGNSVIKDIADGTQKEMLFKYLYTYITNPQDTSNIIMCHGSPGIHLVNIINSLQSESNKRALQGFDIDIGNASYVFNFIGGKLRPLKKVSGKNIFIDEEEAKTRLFSLTNKDRFYKKLAPELSKAIESFDNGILVTYLKEKNIADDFLSEKLVKLYEQEDLFKDFLYNLKNDNPEIYIAFYEYLEYSLRDSDIKKYLDYFTLSTDELLKKEDLL